MRRWLESKLSKRARPSPTQAIGQLDAMVRYAPIGIAFVDRDQRFVEMNDALALLNRRTPAETIGRRVAELPGLIDPSVPDAIQRVLDTGESALDVPYSGPDLELRVGYYPVLDGSGHVTGVGIVVREVSAENQRDLLLDRVTRLQELTAALAVAGTVDDVVGTAVRSVQQATGARGASFWRVDDAATTPAVAVALRTGEPSLADPADVAIPMRGETGVLGAIGLELDPGRRFDEGFVSFLTAAATQFATAFERAVAFDAERAARRAAEDANRRLAYLSEATHVLSQSLDPETTLQRLAELAVPTLADWCAVHVVEGGYARPVAMASENPEATAMVRSLSERHPVPLDQPGLGAVVRTGEAIVMRSVTMDAVRASSRDGEVVDLLSRLRSIAIVPMRSGDRVVGTITLSNTTDRELGDEDVSLAEELAARAAQAVTNAQLFQERNRVASTLQASLLPPSPALIPGVDVATRFTPAEGLDVGGDFYDVFRMGPVGDPAPQWVLVIGDVRGKGADAAAITGTARATIRAAALDERSPASLLTRLNDVLLASAVDDRVATATSEPRFCTACVVTVTPTDDGADVLLAVGGHPLPYLLRADGSVAPVGVSGSLIGAFADPGLLDVGTHMGPGDALVLYTDGVTERHDGRTFFDEAGLEAVLAGCADASALEVAERVEQAANEFVSTSPTDDLAVVVVRLPRVAADGSVARRSLPDDDRAAGVARRFVGDALRANGADVETVDIAVLLTSELVTNAITHGAPGIHLAVHAGPDAFRVWVTDESPTQPVLRRAARHDEHGRGLVLVDALADRWGVEPEGRGKSVWFELDV